MQCNVCLAKQEAADTLLLEAAAKRKYMANLLYENSKHKFKLRTSDPTPETLISLAILLRHITLQKAFYDCTNT